MHSVYAGLQAKNSRYFFDRNQERRGKGILVLGFSAEYWGQASGNSGGSLGLQGSRDGGRGKLISWWAYKRKKNGR